MAKQYRVALAEEEQQELKGLVSRGRAAAYRQTHARILLLCDENQANGSMKDEEIARSLKVGTATVERVRRRCVEEGLERALGRKEQLNRRPKKLDGHDEAQLIALACSQPPEGRASWTLQLLADRLVDSQYQPITVDELPNGELRGYSEALGLYFCWREGRLDWYDPNSEDYIPSQETERQRADTEGQLREPERQRTAAAEERAAAERAARETAEARIRELEARLPHGGSGS